MHRSARIYEVLTRCAESRQLILGPWSGCGAWGLWSGLVSTPQSVRRPLPWASSLEGKVAPPSREIRREIQPAGVVTIRRLHIDWGLHPEKGRAHDRNFLFFPSACHRCDLGVAL